MRHPSQQAFGRGRILAALVLSIGLAWLGGCGGEAYEQRLGNTAKLFARMELLNSNLNQWADPEIASLKLRVPKKFSVILPPTRSEGAAATDPLVDDRQPKYVNVQLPGLRGAFFSPVKVLSAKADDPQSYAYIYVLTNHFQAGTGELSRAFGADVVKNLADALQTSNPDPNAWESVTFPRVPAFAVPVAYRSAVLSPPRPISGSEIQISCYVHDQGEIQVVVLFVVPKDVDSSERLIDLIPLCLETLQIEGDKLRPLVSTPAAGKTGGF